MKILGKVIQSQSDKRAFQAIELTNKLQCLVISDRQAQRSSAALSVGVGSLKDPTQAQGLAHYLQHMLFMGTQKYPDENDYSNFIAKNSGHSNAYTSQEQTNFHFQVATNAFPDALDRFAQFFINPLMSDSSSQRQLNAVHSEHSKNVQNDLWRKYQLSKHLAKKDHPYNKFSTGNKQSLTTPNLRKMLHQFYQQNYSSNLMKMVVYGKEDVQELSSLVKEKFLPVSNKQYIKYKIKDIPYDKEKFNKIYKIVPVKDRKTLQLNWIIGNYEQHYENHPGRYLSHLFGHEGKGSLLSFLISQGLATGLGASYSDSFHCFTQFQVSINLTKKGVNSIHQIIGYVMNYIKMLKEKGPQQWVFREIQALGKMKFDYMQKMQGMSYSSRLASTLHKKHIEEVLAFPFFMKDWKPNLINEFLDELQFHNLMVFAEAKQFQNECNQTEPIYSTKYSQENITSGQPLSCNVDLPPKNIFLPSNLQVLDLGSSEVPTKLYSSDRMEMFWKKDHRFGLPKITVNLKIYYNGMNEVKEDLCGNFYLSMMKQSMRQFVYLAETAGIDASISNNTYFSFDVSLSGFRSSIEAFISPFLKEILAFKPTDQKYFETLKQKTQRNYRNYFLSDPYQLAYSYISMALKEGASLSPLKKLNAIQSIQIGDVLEFSQKWKSQIYIEGLINGNIEESSVFHQIKEIQELFASNQLLKKADIPSIRPIKVPFEGIWAVQEELTSKDEENSAIIVHFQHEASTMRSSVLQELCLSFVKEPAFDYLRTKEQLGYIVMCLPDDHRGVLGLSILVQSQIKSSYQLVEYVNKFVEDILKSKIGVLDQKTFEEYKNSLKSVKMEKDKNLRTQSGRLWGEIIRHKYEFNRVQKQLQILQQLTLQDFKSFVNSIFHLNPRRFEMHIVSEKGKHENQQLRNGRLKTHHNFHLLANVESFKKKMALYPDFYSHL